MKSTPAQKLIKVLEDPLLTASVIEAVLETIRLVLRERGGVVVIWYPDLEVRDLLIREVAGLLVFDVLTPDDEAQAVRELDGCEGSLTDPGREHPAVLFLRRDGNGRTALARSPGLSSLVRGRDVDPEKIAEIDTLLERAKFIENTGNSPEDWLVAWHAGEICRNGDSLCRSYLAAMLVDANAS